MCEQDECSYFVLSGLPANTPELRLSVLLDQYRELRVCSIIPTRFAENAF